jgi:SAM-dependent methyltransferase
VHARPRRSLGLRAAVLLAVGGCAGGPSAPPTTPRHASPDPTETPLHEGVGPAGPAAHRLAELHPPEGHGHTMPHRFEDAARWAERFDAPDRDAWQQPDAVIAALLGGRTDLVVTDLGAGTGYFSVRFARALPQGQVIAADIEPSLLAWVERRAQEARLANVRTHLTRPDGPAWRQDLPKADLVFSCNTYHHLADRPAFFAAVRATLAPGGRVAIVDFTPETEKGPPKAHRIAPEAIIAELGEAGLRLVSRHAFLPDQFLLVFEAAPSDPAPASSRTPGPAAPR